MTELNSNFALLSRNIRWTALAAIVLPTFVVDVSYFVWFAERPAVIGLLGDFYNCIAAVWLAYDLLFKEQEIHRKELIEHFRKEVPQEVPLVVDNIVIEGPWDIDRVFIRRTARQAVTACLLLALGLILVLAARVLEFIEQGHVEELWKAAARGAT